jgi:hypothetical protein
VPSSAATLPRAEPAGAPPRRWIVDGALVAVLVVLAAWLRLGPLGPSSLWLDDAWVALASRTEGLTELRYVGFSAPGFAVLLWAWFRLVGFSELTAQALPFAAGILAPGLGFLVARRFGWHRAAATVGGLVLVASPMAVDYATRVKPYTIESVLALGLLALALHLLREVAAPRRWAAFVAAAALATTISAFLAPYAAAGLAAGLVRARTEGDRLAVSRGLAAGLAYGAFAGAWYLAVLAPAVTTSVSAFWSGHFLVLTEGVGPAVDSVTSAATGVAVGLVALPAGLTVLALLGGAVSVAFRRSDHAVLLVVPSVVAVLLAALQLAPLGGGRTDIYLYPSLALLLAGGADGLVRVLPGWATWVVPGAVLATLGIGAEPVTAYPAQDVRPLVAELEQRRQPGDALLVYPATMWAYALYTSDDLALEADPVSAWGFAPVFDDERTYVLPRGRDDPGAYTPTVEQLGEREQRVWLLASHWRDDYEDLREQLGRAGFEQVELQERPGARLSAWERR